MCLLATQPEGTVFDDDFLSGVYMLNSDGIGVMYAENNSLHIRRLVPKTEKEFIDFFRENIDNRKCAWHARMRTHGDIDLTNCHPYQVISGDEGYPLYLAHNGVLFTGNKADPSKSDTWHYIQDFLRPMLLKNPEFFLTEAFEDMVASHIGTGNKFVLMDAFGNITTVNEQAGVIHQGAWLSNTYAWDTTGTKYASYRSKSKGYAWPPINYGFPGSSFFDDEDESVPHSKSKQHKPSPTEEALAEMDDRLDFCCELFDLIREQKLDADISWDAADAYYTRGGAVLAWSVIEVIKINGYTGEELENEIVGKTVIQHADLTLEAKAA